MRINQAGCKLLAGMVLLICMMNITGCGKALNKAMNAGTFDKQSALNNPNLKAMNDTLGQIQNPQSGQKAADAFVSYMASKFKTPSSNTFVIKNQNSLKPEQMLRKKLNTQKLGMLEYRLRRSLRSNVSAKMITENIQSLVSVQDLADQFNQNNIPVTEMEIQAAQSAIREAIPNLAVNNDSSEMTPLESGVITWALLTGDDGTLPDNSLSSEKLLSISEQSETQISTQAIDPVSFLFCAILILQAVDWSIAKETGYDIFGNPVSENESKIMFIKVPCGPSKRVVEPKSSVTYFSGVDLEDCLNIMGKYIEFDNSNKPANALASLPARPYDYATDRNMYEICKLRGNQPKALSWSPNGRPFYMDLFPKLNKGDLIFSRGVGDIPSYLSKMTSWTHVAMVLDPKNIITLESLQARGVDRYYPKSEWGNAVSWSTKRVNANSTVISNLVDRAFLNWAKTTGHNVPYFPIQDVSKMLKAKWLQIWADKNNLSSMYCSKLVYNTFKPENIDLDSNRTVYKLGVTITAGELPLLKPQFSSDVNDNGAWNSNAWIGVSPDDIYYSKWLGTDIYNEGINNLTKPILIQ